MLSCSDQEEAERTDDHYANICEAIQKVINFGGLKYIRLGSQSFYSDYTLTER